LKADFVPPALPIVNTGIVAVSGIRIENMAFDFSVRRRQYISPSI
jgi:hypothetical protein